MQYKVLVILAVGLLAACGGDDQFSANHSVRFVGQVYDASTGQVITGYTISVLAGGSTREGKIDAEVGRFDLGSIGAFDDYIVTVSAEGFRAFESRNAMIGVPESLANADGTAQTKTDQTLYFDVYLFPTGLTAPEFRITIAAEDDDEAELAGKLRLRPTDQSNVGLEASSVPGQVWVNDLDVQGGVIAVDFEGGEHTFDTGALTYGVRYAVDVYGIDGYQPETVEITAGEDLGASLTVSVQDDTPVALVSLDEEDCTPPTIEAPLQDEATAVITLTFDSDIELVDADSANDDVNDGFAISSTNSDDGIVNALNPLAKGATVRADGNQLIFEWNPADGLQTSDPDDVLNWVVYDSLHYIQVQRAGSPSSVQFLYQLGIVDLVCES